MSTPVIDFHIHYVGNGHWHPWVVEWAESNLKDGNLVEMLTPILASPASLLAHLDDCGVDYAVCLAEESPITTGVVSNDEVAAFCRGQKRLIPFCSINPYLHARPAQLLEEMVQEKGFRGIKLYPTYQGFYPNQPEIYPLYAVAQALQIPVLIHTGSSVFRGARMKYGDPLYLDDVAIDFPRLNIVMAHSGRGFWYDRAFFLARIHPNLYMEVAGLPPQKLLTYFPELERIPDKVIFGSDWPGIPDIRGNIEVIRRLPLKSSTIEKILGGNAARVLGLAVGA